MARLRPARNRASLGSAFGLLVLLVGCGGSAPPHVTSIALTSTANTVRVGGTAHFQVPGYADASVQEWAVNGVSGGNATFGTISSDGIYRAPEIPPSPNSIVITAAGSEFLAEGGISVVNPAPACSSLTPNVALAGAASLTVMLTGSGFTAESQAIADGVPAKTKFLSATSLQVQIPPSVLASAKVASLHVETPSPGGGTTKPLSLTIVGSGSVTQSKNPLVALYDLAVPRDAHVSVEFGPDTLYGKSTSAIATPPGGGNIEIQVAGMRASSTYHMRAHVAFADGATVIDQDHVFVTGAVPPERLPKITVTHFAGMSPSPGIELLNLMFPSSPSTNPINSSAYDVDGNLLWYYDAEPGATVIPIKLLPNGHLLLYVNYNDHVNDSVREIDLAGNTIRDLRRLDLNTALAARGFNLSIGQFHHDLTPLPNGHLILLSQVTKKVDGLAGYSGSTTVWGDVLVDLDQNLTPVWTWSTFDHLDLNRHLMGLPDWTHSNAVVYTPNDGNLLLSIRHQSWVIKIDYQNGAGTGAILWRLGNEGDFRMTSGDASAWQYAQHYPKVVSINGSVLRLAVMDNGNGRIIDNSGTQCGTKGGTPCYSRLAIFDIDEQSMTVTPVWEFRPGFYSFWGGSAEIDPNGDVEGAFSAYGSGSRVIEVTPGANPQPVWQLDVSGIAAYRGFRLPSLYPGIQW